MDHGYCCESSNHPSIHPSIQPTNNFVSGIEGLPASVSLQHSQTTSDALTLHFGFDGVVLLLLPTHLAFPGL